MKTVKIPVSPILCTLFLLFLYPANGAETPFEKNIVAHWTLDDDTLPHVKDKSGNGLNGVLKGNNPELVTLTEGITRKGLSFAIGNECKVVLPKKDALVKLEPPFTIAAWVRIAKKDTRSFMDFYCSMSDTDKTGLRLRIGYNAFWVYWADGKETHSLKSPTMSVRDQTWTHLAVTHDGKTLRIFVDAEEVAATRENVTVAPARRAPVIGNYVASPKAYEFAGTLDEIVILNKALNSEDIYLLAKPDASTD